MVKHILLTSSLLMGLIAQAANGVRGQETGVIESQIGGRQVKMMLTGSAVRTKSIFKIYTVNSYVEHGLKVRTAKDMIDADRPKQLHLVMLRDVPGPDMASAFTALLRSNHPEPEFNEEAKTVAALIRGRTANKGDEIWFTHVPGVGLHCQAKGGVNHLVRNVEFSKAVWENYFGKHNVGEAVKEALLSRLPRE